MGKKNAGRAQSNSSGLTHRDSNARAGFCHLPYPLHPLKADSKSCIPTASVPPHDTKENIHGVSAKASKRVGRYVMARPHSSLATPTSMSSTVESCHTSRHSIADADSLSDVDRTLAGAGSGVVEEAERKARQRTHALRKLEAQLEQTARRRRVLERELTHGSLQLLSTKATDTLLQESEHNTLNPVRPATSKDTGGAHKAIDDFVLQATSSVSGTFMWPAPVKTSPLVAQGWAMSRAVERFVAKAQSHLLTGRLEQAEEELERAWRARVGVSAHKLFRIGSCHALAHLAQGNYAASAKKSMEQLERLEKEAKAALTSGGMRAAASAAAPEGMVQQLMRTRRSGHAPTDKEREERVERQRHHGRMKQLSMLYNKGLAQAHGAASSGSTHQFREAIKSFTAALDINPSHTTVLHARASVYKALGMFREAIADLDRAEACRPLLHQATHASVQSLDFTSNVEQKAMASDDEETADTRGAVPEEGVSGEQAERRRWKGQVPVRDAHLDPEILRILRARPNRRTDDECEALARVLAPLQFFAQSADPQVLTNLCCRTITYRRYGARASVLERGETAQHMMIVWNGSVQLTADPPVDKPAAEAIVRPTTSERSGQLSPKEVRHRGEEVFTAEALLQDVPVLAHVAAAAEGCLLLMVGRADYIHAHEAAIRGRVEADVQFLQSFYALPVIDLFDRSGVWGAGDALHQLVMHKMEMLTLPGKTRVTQQGDPSDGIFFIRRGRCEVRRKGYHSLEKKKRPRAYGLLKEVLRAVDAVDAEMAAHEEFFSASLFLAKGDAVSLSADEAGLEVGNLRAGDWFGGESVLSHEGAGQGSGVDWLYSISTTEPTTLLKLPRASLFHLQSRSLDAVRSGLVPWIEGLPKGCLKDAQYAAYKDKVLRDVLSSDRARSLRGQRLDRA